MLVDVSDDPGTAQMARRHEQITAEIAALKALALEELHNHHPENAIPLLEEALALHSALKGSCREAQPPRTGQLDDPDFLSADELEVIREGAHRTAFDLDEFDPLSELERERKEFDVTLASDVHIKAGQSPDLIPKLDDLSYDLDNEEPDGTVDLELDDQPLVDLTAGLPEPDEYEEAPTREEIEGIRVDSKITRSERARQEAIQLGTKFGWGSDEIDLLTEVFYLHSWSSSKRAMIRELERGMTSHELRLALTVRKIWRLNPEFHVSVGQGRRSYSHPNLTWPMALTVARHYEFDPDPAEISATFQNLYNQWRYSHAFMRQFTNFCGFVRLQFGMEVHSLDDVPGWSFVPSADARLTDDDMDAWPESNYWFGYGCYRTHPTLIQD